MTGGIVFGTVLALMRLSGRKWLDTLANTLVKTGTKVQHVSNNAPFGLADFGSPEADARRKAGVAMAKRWLEGCAVPLLRAADRWRRWRRWWRGRP